MLACYNVYIVYIYMYMYLYTLRIMGSRVIGGLNWRSTSEPCVPFRRGPVVAQL